MNYRGNYPSSLKLAESTVQCAVFLLQVNWSHATNSGIELAEALASSVMMIEADVSLGKADHYCQLAEISAFFLKLNRK